MKLKFWLVLGALVFIIFGIGFVVAPSFMGKTFGMTFDDASIMMSRLLGAVFLFASIVLWSARNSPASASPVKGIIVASVLTDIIGFVVTLMGTLSDTMNSLGWLPVALWAIFGVVFIYFLFAKPTV